MTFPKFSEEEYRVPFFSENGFIRRKCKVCGEYFWTQIHEQEICGESPCCDYTFIGAPPTRRRYNLRDMREAFLSFFERRGHKRISPYPIVARWRDDLYFTDASIVDFQPYVTDGIIPPPFNPLVISQPCLRFVDVDNVGLTFGRHLTIFEMGGAHAFNYPDKEVYWKDQTVRYHHEFVTKELGIRSEKVTYKEGIWSGGGNAGPDLETLVDGLELATLVFMYYKVKDGEFVELPIRTVDTGYGMERYTWLSQGTISCFHAVYGPILHEVLKLAGLTLDEKLLSEYSRYTSTMKLEKVADAKKLRSGIAEKMDIDVETLHNVLVPIENAYAVLDHSKCLAFMLAEGVVPSNVREGYLARLILRRMYRLLRSLGIEHELINIVDLQIDYWSPDLPLLEEMRDEIVSILSVEEKKYKETLKRGVGLVRKICSDIKAKGFRELPLDALIELYDSHGIPPTLAKETAEEEGVIVSVPDNFYNMVATRHIRARPPEVAPLERLADKLVDLPATRALYYEDQYLREFEAEVLKTVDDKYVVLDKTAFYPEGGGQPPDQGSISWEGGQATIVDVQKVGNIVVHIIEGMPPETGTKVKGEIDWERRLSLMRHHTATHVLIGAVRRVLGEHAWQAGAQKDVICSRLDVSHHKRITSEELNEIEITANSAIMKNYSVKIDVMPKEKAESLYGFRLYQGGVVPGREIRVVKIGDWDVEACGGTHCSSLGEVGMIKIIRTDRIQDGVERLEFSAGLPAIKLIQEREGLLREAARICKASVEKLVEGIESIIASRKRAEKEVERLRKSLIKYEAERMIGEAKPIARIRLLARSIRDVDVDYLIGLGAELVKIDPRLVVVLFGTNKTARIVGMAGDEAVKEGIHAGDIVRETAKVVGGGGSGEPSFGQGGGPLVDEVPLAIGKLEELVRNRLRDK